MYYTIPIMPTIYLSSDLPSIKLTIVDEAIAKVPTIAKNNKFLAWLKLSRREIVFIDEV